MRWLAVLYVSVAVFAGAEQAKSHPLADAHMTEYSLSWFAKGINTGKLPIDKDCSVLVRNRLMLKLVDSRVSGDHDRDAPRGNYRAADVFYFMSGQFFGEREGTYMSFRPFLQVVCRCQPEVLNVDNNSKDSVALRVFGDNRDQGSKSGSTHSNSLLSP